MKTQLQPQPLQGQQWLQCGYSLGRQEEHVAQCFKTYCTLCQATLLAQDQGLLPEELLMRR